MADISNVDPDRIKAAVSQLSGINDALAAQVAKIKEAVKQLDSGWTSAVKAGFMQKYKLDEAAADEMLVQLREFTDALSEAASDFDKTESGMMGAVSALR